MKRTVNIIISTILAIIILAPTATFAKQATTQGTTQTTTPVLTSISFKGAQIVGEFSPDIYEYTLNLTDDEQTPTLESYKADGDPYVFVTYISNDAKQQTGVAVTLESENVSVVYNFNYPTENTSSTAQSSNNLLSKINCKYGEVYPAINDNDTSYDLYIPSDLTQITLSAATQDINAYCQLPGTIILNKDQQPTITITVTAADSTTREYTLKVKRLDKTIDEVKDEMADPNFTSLVEGELYYQQPVFIVTVSSIAGGLLILLVFIKITKKMTKSADDADEKEFFDM